VQGGLGGTRLKLTSRQIMRLPIASNSFITALLMLKQFFTALLCGLALAGQMRAQEVVVAREEKPRASEQAPPVSERADSESATATRMDAQARKKKSASTILTVEQMRMAGALAAERQKNQARVEQTSTTAGPGLQAPETFGETLAAERQKKQTRLEQPNVRRAPNSRTGKSEDVGPIRPTMIESEKQEPAPPHPEKTEVRGEQTGAPQSANRALWKKEPIPSTANSPDGDSASTPGRDQEITKEKAAKGTRTVAHYSYKTAEGKKESIPVITQYYPQRIVYPFAKVDRHIDGKLMQAATIAQERAHAHSRSMCWHYVKEALLASGVIDSRPKSELAKDAAQDLVSNYGFKRLPVKDPFAAPVGSVLVYGANRAAGHVEIRTRDGFVSDFYSKTPSRRPLLGVYAKL
jgi:hypothetical protein